MTNKFKPKYVESIPSELEEGILYISEKYRTTSHLCACGCKEKVALTLKPGGWKLIKGIDDKVSLKPSVGNFSLDCQSHYFITDNEIEWARVWSDEEIEAGWADDEKARNEFYEKRRSGSLLYRLWNWFKNLWH
jgi:hypothetical protein